jgi:guanylate kinase
MARYPKAAFGITATTRAPRPGEVDGVNYHFLDEERFKRGLADGEIPEHYYRPDTNTYYGLYKPGLDAQIAAGCIVFFQIQIVGAKYLKEHYGATTIFIMPSSLELLEQRIRARAPMSDVEWQERLAHTRREMDEDALWYDYRVTNEEGKLDETVARVLEILQKEGYTLG